MGAGGAEIGGAVTGDAGFDDDAPPFGSRRPQGVEGALTATELGDGRPARQEPCPCFGPACLAPFLITSLKKHYQLEKTLTFGRSRATEPPQLRLEAVVCHCKWLMRTLVPSIELLPLN